MGLEDHATLHLSSDHQPLVISSRPGYLQTKGVSQEACRVFVDSMQQERIVVATVLMTEMEVQAFYGFDLCGFYAAHGVEPLLFPIEDGWFPEDHASFQRLMETLWKRLKSEKVLVHCNAGLGRSGVVAAALLIFGGTRWETAIARVRKARRGALENQGQEDFLRRYDHALRGGELPG